MNLPREIELLLRRAISCRMPAREPERVRVRSQSGYPVITHHYKVIGAAQDGGSDKDERYVWKSERGRKEDKTPKAGQHQRVSDSEIQQKAVHEYFDLSGDSDSSIWDCDDGIIRTCVRWRT
jgi:hypothetical protein